MIKAVFFNSAGEPEATAIFSEEGDAKDSGGVLVDTEMSDEDILDTFYLKGGEVKRRHPAPSMYHRWLMAEERWQEDLYKLRQDKLSEVDQLAEVERGKYITSGSGQAMTYEAKVREARVGAGPMIEAEAEALEMTVEEVAASVLAAHDQWQAAGSQIEAARLKAKKDIRAATTANEMHQITKALQQELSS